MPCSFVEIVLQPEEAGLRDLSISNFDQGNTRAPGHLFTNNEIVRGRERQRFAGQAAELKPALEPVLDDPGVPDWHRGHDPQSPFSEFVFEFMLAHVGILFDQFCVPVGPIVFAEHKLRRRSQTELVADALAGWSSDQPIWNRPARIDAASEAASKLQK